MQLTEKEGAPHPDVETGNGSAADQGFALTPTQQGMLAAALASESRGLNVEQVVCELGDDLDELALRCAWQRALDTFDALRLQFDFGGEGDPVQRVQSSPALPFRHVDWAERDPANADQALQEFLEQDRWQGFDLSGTPLFRVSVFRFPCSRTFMVWTVHQLIVDRPSYPLVISSVLDHIESSTRPVSPNPAPNAARYRDFLAWLGNRDPRCGVEYYRKVLCRFSEPTPLPFAGTGSPPTATVAAAHIGRCVDKNATSLLDGMAAQSHASLNTVVQLAWGVLLARYAGRDDVVFGATWSGRAGTIAEPALVVGPFINTLPVRVDLSANPSCRDALTSLREQHVGSRPYRQTPATSVKEASELSRAVTMFRTLVVFQGKRPLGALERDANGKGPRKFRTHSQTGYALALEAHVERDCLYLDLEYDARLFDVVQANELLDALVRVLQAMPSALDEGVAALPVIEPDLYRAMTIGEAGREVVASRPRVIDRIMELAQRQPQATAICDLQGGTIDYGQLQDRVLRVAAALRRRGVRDGAMVAILIPRSIAAVVAQLAVHRAGGAFLMLDPGVPETRLRYCLADSGAQWLIVSLETGDAIVEPTVQTLDIDALDREGRASAGGFADSTSMKDSAGHTLSYLIYTSGSTGEPKGVRISEGALANHIAASIELYGLHTRDRVLQFSAQSFDASIEDVFSSLAAGATLVLRSEAMAGSPREFFDALAANRISVVDLPTAYWHQIVHLSDDRRWPECVRLLVVGGERASPGVLRRFRDSGNGHVRWLNSYGPTETTIGSTVYDDACGDHDADCLPIGRALPGHSHYLLDDRLRPVPPGTAGHLYIGGAGVALGYHERETLTAQRFIAHPWRSGAKLYATGDLARRTPQGNLVFVGRVDDQVKVRGFRVELGEIETRLRQHPYVVDAAVVASKRGDEALALVGFVESKGDLTPLAIREYLASTLPHYMVPGHIVVLAQLPRMISGKIDRQVLKTLKPDQEPADSAHEPGMDPLEVALVEIWSELLGVPVRGSQSDFFDLGGNSLNIMSLFTAIEKRLGKTLNPVEFLRTPTLKHLAGMIRREQAATNACCLRMKAGRPGVRPLFFTPGVMGSGNDYVHLVNALDRCVPAYALQIRGWRAGEVPHTDLREAARDYVSWMQEVQPSGPYALAGYSAGCIVIIDIARELLERGERVDFVGMIDGTPPPTVEYPSCFSSAQRFACFMHTVLGRVLEVLKEANPVRLFWQRGSVAARRVFGQWFLGESDKDTTIDQIFVGRKVAFQVEDKRLLQAHLLMLMQSDSTPVPIDIVLFRTAFNPLVGPYESDLGWSRLVSGRIIIENMPGNHNDLIRESGSPGLGRQMNKYLAQRAA
jgi:amino acid adenylation domain-containing protein